MRLECRTCVGPVFDQAIDSDDDQIIDRLELVRVEILACGSRKAKSASEERLTRKSGRAEGQASHVKLLALIHDPLGLGAR